MTAQVLADARFLTPERLMELREHGDVQVSLQSVLEDLDLPEPRPGESVVGVLELAEARLYRQLYDANLTIENIARDAMGRQLSMLGETLRQSDRNKPLSEVLSDRIEIRAENSDEAREFARAQQHLNMLHACFYYHVGERLDSHEWRLGVRSKGRVVRIEMR